MSLNENSSSNKDGPCKSVMIYSDCTGGSLEPLLRSLTPHSVTTAVYPGATLERICEKMREDALLPQADLVIVMGGVHNLTTKDEDGAVLVAESTPERLADWMELMLIKANCNIKKLLRKDQKLVFCDIMGLDLCAVNGVSEMTDKLEKEQAILSKAVEDINRRVQRLNNANRVFGPWFTRFSSRDRWSGCTHKSSHFYKRTLDGVRPNKEIRARMARQLVACIQKNLQTHYSLLL